MQIKYLLIFLSILLTNNVKAQDYIPYFIMAYNYNNYDEQFLDSPYIRNTYNSYLFAVNRDSLIVVDTLNTNFKFEIRHIRNLNKFKLWYFEEYANSLSVIPECITIFDYSGKFLMHRFIPLFDSTYSHLSNVYPIYFNQKLVFCNEYNKLSENYSKYYGRDKYFKKYEIKPIDFNKIIPQEIPGFQRSKFEEFKYQYINKKKYLEIPFSNEDGTFQKSEIQEPSEFINDRKLRIIVNNENYFIGCPGIYGSKNDSTLGIKIFNKHTNYWTTTLIPGILGVFMNYNDWIYGTAKTLEGHHYYLNYDDIEIKYLTRYSQNYGALPDVQYYPGILYLFNISINKMIKWNTGDRDSEIISINDDIIYYRVFDEIRTVELDTKRNEIDWSSQKVLIKDKKRVPNIHWMFFAPKQDKIEEIWVNKPKEVKKKK